MYSVVPISCLQAELLLELSKLSPAEVDTIVAIMADGKEHALCVGVVKMSTEDLERVSKGLGIENIHYLKDGL